MENIKINESYINELKKIQEEYNNTTVMLGAIAIQKLMIEEQEHNCKKTFFEYRKKEDEIVAKIKTEYGEGNVNFETGELIKN
jgi:hypothetical protein